MVVREQLSRFEVPIAMSEQLKESLSAVMDGEADEFEIRRVLNEAAQDEALRGVWTRYHLVRSVMRGEGRITRRSELGGAFWARVDATEVSGADDAEVGAIAATAQGAATSRAWPQRILGVAVAASVAAAVIIGFGRNDGAPQLDGAAPAIAQMQSSVTAGERLASVDQPLTTPAAYPSAVDLRNLQAKMLRHEQQKALSNQGRGVPFVKMAAFESQ